MDDGQRPGRRSDHLVVPTLAAAALGAFAVWALSLAGTHTLVAGLATATPVPSPSSRPTDRPQPQPHLTVVSVPLPATWRRPVDARTAPAAIEVTP